jgi:hypothetical protein
LFFSPRKKTTNKKHKMNEWMKVSRRHNNRGLLTIHCGIQWDDRSLFSVYEGSINIYCISWP